MKRIFTGLLVLCTVLAFTSCKNHSQAVSSTLEKETVESVNQETTHIAVSSVTSSVNTQTSTTITPTVATATKKPTLKPSATTSKRPSTTACTGPKHPTSGIHWDGVTQADPETGLSWDGVSPIVYTYDDGTTGTVPRMPGGNSFEFVPGLIRVYFVPCDDNNRAIGSICAKCGKSVGNGMDGKDTCYQTDHSQYCRYCGKWVESHSCHSCNSKGSLYCEHCGRQGGDGQNGTCLRYWTGGDHVCEHCGVTVPVDSCHSCK